MTFVNLTDDQCQAGAFMDALAPDVRAKAVTIDLPAPQPIRLADAVADVVHALRYVQTFGRLSSEEWAVVNAALAKWEAWRAQK